ncbi:MAG: sulfatase-like hydrolase/transferase, partial [Gemmatimonadales bacterium]|nr:sulfatase-like hydrolase/transferase [Gemmatimonadales bacterium]
MVADQLAVVRHHLEEAPQTPFFLLLHTYEVHNYFQGKAHCLERFDEGYLGPLTDPRRLAEAALHGSPDLLSAADLRFLRDLYDGEIRHTDRYLGLFFEWLLEQPWGKNTIVIVTADHGEALGGHGTISHGGTPYQEVARVPLLIRLPDGRWAGRRVAQPVALVDLLPTVLELAGVGVPQGPVGRSLLPALHGEHTPNSSPIFCEGRGAAVLVRQGRWCYVGWRGERSEELYDIVRDPGQSQNIAAPRPEQVREMRRLL